MLATDDLVQPELRAGNALEEICPDCIPHRANFPGRYIGREKDRTTAGTALATRGSGDQQNVVAVSCETRL